MSIEISLHTDLLKKSLESTVNLLSVFLELDSSEFEAEIKSIYGDSINIQKARIIIQDVVENLESWDSNTSNTLDFQLDNGNILSIYIFDGDVLTANGAYSNNTIYLSDALLTQNDPDLIMSVLLEELGHFLDSQLNTFDVEGDEGELFASIVKDEKLTQKELIRIKNEDDSGRILLNDGTEVEVEFSSHSSATLVNTVDLSTINPSSPDPAGIAYLDSDRSLLVSDSEVNEMSIFQGKNTFKFSLSGNLLNTGLTTSYSDEPTGVAYNPNNGHVFISDDDDKKIYEVDPGADGQYFTGDDIVASSINTTAFGSNDPEGVTYASDLNSLFFVDGINEKVYRINLGAEGGLGGNEDTISSFDTTSFGLLDPEGIAFNKITGNLYLVGNPINTIFEVTTGGQLVQTIDISVANPVKPAGLTFAPSSQNTSDYNIYVVDRGIDNNADSKENDGRIYEFSIPGSSFPDTAPPEVLNPLSDIDVSEDAVSTTIDLTNVFTDPDIDDDYIIKTVEINSNPSLVNASISGNILTLNYLPNQFGTANITIRGTSNGKSVEDTFVVNVEPVDDAPTVINYIQDVRVIENAPSTLIDLTDIFDDIDNENSQITKEIILNSNQDLVTATLDGNNLTLNYQADQSGTAEITIRATSNGKTIDETFTVMVLPPGNLIEGTDGRDDFDGTNERDIILAFEGDDKIDAKEGNDVVFAGTGNDEIKGDKGNDLIFGEDGNDKLEGEDNNDTIYGGDDDDTLKGGNNSDLLYGEDGNDKLEGGDDNDLLIGGKGNDDLRGNNDDDIIIGVDPNYNLPGINEIDSLEGGSDGDIFVLGDQNRAYYNDGDDINQGLNDYALITDFDPNEGDKIQLYGDASNYSVASTINGLPSGTAIYLNTSGVPELIAILENISDFSLNDTSVIYSSDSASSYDVFSNQTIKNTINGDEKNNNLSGTDSDDIINGFEGDDSIDGKQGNDILYGDNGKDEIKGGDGDDTLYGGSLDDKLEGQDGNDLLYGNDGDDEIKGGKNDDTAYGNDGDDEIKGEDGNDRLYGNDGNDSIEGNNQDDELFGDAGNDTLDGGEGDDIIFGGLGNDELYGDKGVDTLIGVDPDNQLPGNGEIDIFEGGDQGDLFILGDTNQAYYNDGDNNSLGLGDYVVITDFESEKGDMIQLHGSSDQYTIGSSPANVHDGTAIFLKTDEQDELIGVIQGDTSDLELDNPDIFNFV